MPRITWVVRAHMNSILFIDLEICMCRIENCGKPSCSTESGLVLACFVIPSEFVVSLFVWVRVNTFAANDVAGHCVIITN